jgi:predicted KAP-like P-loop ATPase
VADALHRTSFARSVTDVLKRVSPEAGLVASLEGAWGSGKTSLLAMLEDLIEEEPEATRPVVVHFNPWLIGDRDALLRQFFASIAKAVRLTDHAKEGKRVAKELKTYSKAFDVLKLIPGAEPWASIVKSVVESMGNATEAVADYKTPDIEARKEALEQALRKFPRRIVVFVDDIDRLFPAEAFEMVRIVKAVCASTTAPMTASLSSTCAS